MAGTAPAIVETPRLRLRRPAPDDAAAIFARYASDGEVTRYLSWPRHATLADTERFLAFSAQEWDVWPAGPYLIERRDGGTLLGSTGLAFVAPGMASTGYVLARDAWGRGFASEALAAVVGVAAALGLAELTAVCHPDHRASARVLEKGGFVRSDRAREIVMFPNIAPARPVACPIYRRVLTSGREARVDRVS